MRSKSPARAIETARLDALIERARAWMAGDNVVDVFASLVEAIDLASAIGDLGRLGEAIAAANVEGLWFAGEVGGASTEIGAAIERALPALPGDMTTARALGLSAVADYSYFWRPVDELDAMTAEAVALTRRSGDDTVLARTLHKRNQAMYRPSTFDARADAADELRSLAETGRLDGVTEAEGLFVAASVHWDRVELLPALALVERAQRLSERTGSAALISQLGLFRGSILTTLGRLTEAIARIEAAAELYRRTRRLSAETFRLSFLSMPAFELDDRQPVLDLVELAAESALRPSADGVRDVPLRRDGRSRPGRALIGNGLPPPDDTWLLLGATTAGAHVRVALGDEEGAAALLPRLAPYVGRLGASGTGVAFGDVALAVARIHHLLGHDGEARALADRSVSDLGRSGPSPWLVGALLFRAELAGDEGDHARAAGIVDQLDLPLLRRRL